MKPKDDLSKEAIALARRVRALERRAEQEYRPVVETMLRTGTRDVAHIERTLDGLLDFCGHEPVLALYKQLCRHYWAINPTAAADYIAAYRERWDNDSDAAGRPPL